MVYDLFPFLFDIVFEIGVLSYCQVEYRFKPVDCCFCFKDFALFKASSVVIRQNSCDQCDQEHDDHDFNQCDESLFAVNHLDCPFKFL